MYNNMIIEYQKIITLFDNTPNQLSINDDTRVSITPIIRLN